MVNGTADIIHNPPRLLVQPNTVGRWIIKKESGMGSLFCVRPARTYSNGCKSLSRPNSGKATAEGKGVPVRRNLKEAVSKHLTRRTET